jgi:hypothetical protein
MSLYALNTSYNNASTSAYCSVSLTAGTLVNGVGQCVPSSTAFTYMSFQGAISYQVPPGDASVGGTVDATTNVAGSVIVSPPLNVDFTVELFGRGKVLGTYTVPAGQTSGQFNFNVSSADAIPQEEMAGVMEKVAKPRK